MIDNTKKNKQVHRSREQIGGQGLWGERSW